MKCKCIPFVFLIFFIECAGKKAEPLSADNLKLDSLQTNNLINKPEADTAGNLKFEPPETLINMINSEMGIGNMLRWENIADQGESVRT